MYDKDEEDEQASGMMFEWLLRDQRRFLERLLKLGVGDEAKASIEQRLKDIVDTLEK